MTTDHVRASLASRPDRSPPRLVPLAAVAIVALACGDGRAATGPSQQGGGQPGDTSTSASLVFVRPEAAAPAIVPSAQFYAVKGQDRRVRLYYQPSDPAAADTVEFMTFRVDKETLDRRPDGSAIATGDSVLITVTLRDAANLVVDFAPSGLRFSAARPARLHFNLALTDDDRNRDGTVNGSDDTVSQQLLIWRQEAPDQPWVAQPSVLNLAEQQIETDVLGFTGYAVAYRKPK